MRYSPVKVKIIERGLTIRELIRRLKLPASLTYMNLRGERHTREVQEAIAEFLEEPANALFGDDYWGHHQRQSA